MPKYNIAEFKAHLSSLVNRALAGEEVIDLPPARRTPGSARDVVKVAADFDETPQDLAEYTR